MGYYIVTVEERHEARYYISAESEEEAKRKAIRGDWDDVLGTEFIEVVPDAEVTVEPEK